mmetsp:Transcript_12812/g.27792  ORF Transcript_12812/g.27792 Transcript_12812/m.27792 type:complete len:232 (-) Transcript_12812:1376-2071(-)
MESIADCRKITTKMRMFIDKKSLFERDSLQNNDIGNGNGNGNTTGKDSSSSTLTVSVKEKDDKKKHLQSDIEIITLKDRHANKDKDKEKENSNTNSNDSVDSVNIKTNGRKEEISKFSMNDDIQEPETMTMKVTSKKVLNNNFTSSIKDSGSSTPAKTGKSSLSKMTQKEKETRSDQNKDNALNVNVNKKKVTAKIVKHVSFDTNSKEFITKTENKNPYCTQTDEERFHAN